MFNSNGLVFIEPDKTFYEQVKGVTLTDNKVKDLHPSRMPAPKSLNLSDNLLRGWKEHHAPLIELSFMGNTENLPFRSIFPGPFIPGLDGKMEIIGDFAYSVYENILKSLKQRIPNLKSLKKNSKGYHYKSEYKPLVRKISEPEEGWNFYHIKCPIVNGINFPLPPMYEFEPQDITKLSLAREFIESKCRDFCLNHLGIKKSRTKNDIEQIISLIRTVQYLFDVKPNKNIVMAFDEILKNFDKLNTPPKNPALFLFEIEHALSYLVSIKNFELVGYGKYDTYWADIIKLPIENLVETELGDIQRVLREIRTFFTLGWSPIIVHFHKKSAFNTDGTHRHYAILTIELLRRLKLAHGNIPIRNIDLGLPLSLDTIRKFQIRFNKQGLSFRETLRTVNYLVNNETTWPYLNDLDHDLTKILSLELKYIPVIYLPEWRARSVVKNLCDKGIALVGVPPENIYLVGKSKGKKGIFIRGGYHGTDRQPMVWMNIIDLQKI